MTDLATFAVHADPAVESADRAGLERMLRYAARPAFAQKRLGLLPSDKVCYRLRRPYYTGQTEVVLEPGMYFGYRNAPCAGDGVERRLSSR